MLIGAYVASACSATLGGIFLVGYIGIASPGIGDKFLFASVAAVVVGGASILGGSGSYLGTLAGALLLTLINILLTVFSMSAGTISIFYGLTICSASGSALGKKAELARPVQRFFESLTRSKCLFFRSFYRAPYSGSPQ